MKGKFKKAISLAVSLLLVLVFISGCGSSAGTAKETLKGAAVDTKQPEPAQDTGKKAESPKGKEVSTEPIILNVWLGESWLIPTVNPNFDDEIAKKITEKTRIKLNFQMAKSSDWQSELNIMMASNELPDLIETDGSYVSKLKAGNYIIPMDEYLDKYAPNFKSRLGDTSKFWRDLEDGKLYQFKSWSWNSPKYVLPIRGPYLVIRYDILKELGFKNLNKDSNPNITWDEYVDLLKQVKQKYPGMIPLELGDDINNAFDIVKAALGYKQFIVGASTAVFCYEDNAAKYMYDSKGSLDTLKLLNGLYNQGLVDRSFATLKLDQVKSKIASGKVFSFMGEGTPVGDSLQALQKDNEEKRFVVFNLIKDQSVAKTYVNGYYIAGVGSLVVSKNCKYPERVAQLFDFTASEEGSMLCDAGIEGKFYTRDSDGKVKPNPEYSNAYANWDTNFFQKTGLTSYENIFPTLAGLDAKGNAADIFAQEMYTNNKWNMFDTKFFETFTYRGDYFTDILTLNPDSQQEAFEAMTKIGGYANDRIRKCIIVKPEDLDKEWNSLYVQMKKDGLDKLNSAITDNLNNKLKKLGTTIDEALK